MSWRLDMDPENIEDFGERVCRGWYCMVILSGRIGDRSV